MKSITLVFYGADGDVAKGLAAKIRKEGGGAQIRHAYAFDGEKEPCDRVVLLSDVSKFDADRLHAVYSDKIDTGSALPPPPPPPFDPLANLPPDWKNEHGARLKSIAQSLSGRAVENKDQAVSVIEAALAARA